MEDEKIIDLLWRRCEAAVEQLDRKYGGYCFSIANRILDNRQDAEECVSDTYLAAWNRIPPTRPNNLAAFLGRITRNLSISRWRSRSAISRGGGEMDLALEELAGCVAGPWDVTRELEQKELERAIGFSNGLQRYLASFSMLPSFWLFVLHKKCLYHLCVLWRKFIIFPFF